MRNTTVKVKNIGVAVFGLLALCLWLLAIPLKAQDISEADLIRAMENLIREASEFSQDLAQYIDKMGEDWELWDPKPGDNPNTTDKETHKIKFSRADLKEYVKLLNKRTTTFLEDIQKEKMKWWYIDLILHEAGHRKALEKGYCYDDRAAEEVRNGTELINRYIDILEQLNRIICGQTPGAGSDGADLFPGLTPEQAKQLFDRITELIKRENEYIGPFWKELRKDLHIDKAIEEWKQTGKKDGLEWKAFKTFTTSLGINIEIETYEETPTPEGRKAKIKINGKYIDREPPPMSQPGDCERDQRQGSLFKKVDFGLGIKGTYSLARTGDFSGANDYIETIYKDCMESKVSTRCFSGTTPIQLEAFARYTLPNGHRLGLSTGCRFYPGRTSGYTVNSYYETLNKTFDFSFFSIPLDVSYQIPVSLWNRSLFVNFGTGLDFLSGTIQYDDTATYRYTRDEAMGKPLANGGTTYYRGKLKDSCLGGHVSVGLAYPFKANLEFMLQAGLNFGSLTGFKGTVTDQAGKNLDVILGKEEQATGYWLPLYLAGALTDQQQAARVSPGGLGISLGLRYYFGKQPAPNSR